MNDHTEEPRVRIHTGTSGHAVVRLDGLTCEDIEAALADADVWVEVIHLADIPEGARLRNDWRKGDSSNDVLYVHRDDLPTDPDAELVEKMARAGHAAVESPLVWEDRSESFQDEYRSVARAALAVVREHEARS